MIVCAVEAHIPLLQNYAFVLGLHCLPPRIISRGKKDGEGRQRERTGEQENKTVIAYQFYYHNCFQTLTWVESDEQPNQFLQLVIRTFLAYKLKCLSWSTKRCHFWAPQYEEEESLPPSSHPSCFSLLSLLASDHSLCFLSVIPASVSVQKVPECWIIHRELMVFFIREVHELWGNLKEHTLTTSSNI